MFVGRDSRYLCHLCMSEPNCYVVKNCNILYIFIQRHGVVIEWRYSDEETSGDSEWAVINSAAVTFTHHNVSGL